jgi:hypothetical protein
MIAICAGCGRNYDDARMSTICPHPEFLTVEQATQKDLAVRLIGRHVLFAHKPEGVPPALVTTVHWDGMIELEGWSGQFAPHAFVLAD